MTTRVTNMQRRGVAAITAVSLLALVGVTLAAMGSLFAAEARRTRDATTEAQLRQLLLSGAAVAGQRAPFTAEATIELPPLLAADGARLVLRPVKPADGDAVVIDVQAAFADRRMTQRVRYAQRDGRWRVDSADLGP